MFDVDDTQRPRAGSRRRLLGGLLGTAAATLTGVAPPATTRAHPSSSYCVESFEDEMLRLINDHRAANGRGRLSLRQNIGAAAQHHSADMADRNYFSHTTQGTGEGPSQRMIAHGYPANTTWWGENIYAGYGIQNGVDLSSAQAAFNAWKNSSGHNANMLNPNYTVIGIDRSSNPNSQYRNYWTTDFGGASDAAAVICGGTPPPSPTPVRLTIVGHRQSSNSTGGALAYDGSPTSAWRSYSGAPSSAWVRFDLGSARALSEIRWQFSQIGNADQFTVQVSTDAVNWQTLATRTNAPAAGAWETLTTSAMARYVRFNFANPNRDSRIGYLSEVQIYGPSTSSVTTQRESAGGADFALVPAVSSENAGGREPSAHGRKERRRKSKNKKRGNGKKKRK